MHFACSARLIRVESEMICTDCGSGHRRNSTLKDRHWYGLRVWHPQSSDPGGDKRRLDLKQVTESAQARVARVRPCGRLEVAVDAVTPLMQKANEVLWERTTLVARATPKVLQTE